MNRAVLAVTNAVFSVPHTRGMNRRKLSDAFAQIGVPHTRGDEPMGAGMNVQKSLCSHILVTYNIVSGLVL